MADEKSDGLDLFGNPFEIPRETRGRKAHKRSAHIAEMVAVLKATGGDEATQEKIAQRVGLSVPTLTKYYFRELEGGPALARQALIGVMWRKAMVGNVGAARWIDEKLSKGELDEFLARTGASSTPRPAGATASQSQEPPAGKKAQANEAARTAHEGTEWGNLLKH